MDTQHPELGQLVVSGKASLEAVLKGWAYLQRLPKPRDQSGENFKAVLYGLTLNLPAATKQQEELQGIAQARKNALAWYAAAVSDVKSIQLTLPKIASRHCGGATEDRVLTVDFNEQWGPVSGGDWATLVNVCGRKLTNCTILVQLRGIGGDVVQNVHFVDAWKPSQSLYAKYENSYEGWPKQTCVRVQEVEVSIWCDELKAENIRYVYAGREQDKDIARYCDKMAFLPSYRPLKTGLVWDDHRAVNVRLQGIAYIRNPKITVTFYRGEESVGWFWEFDVWKAGESKMLDTKGSLTWEPDHYKVTVSFPHTSYIWSRKYRLVRK